MPQVTVGDISMYYVDAGAGDPVLLIMGFGGDHLAWGLQMPAFAERHRTIAYDNRGVGQSSTPDVPYTTSMMADDAAGLLEALGIDSAHVVSVSMGGMIAQELALRHPGRVRTLQLHATYGRPDRYMAALSDVWRTVRTKLGREEWLRTRSGARSASSCAIMPPIDRPMTCAGGRSRKRSSLAASSARSATP